MALTMKAWLCLLVITCFEPVNVSGLTSPDGIAHLDFSGETRLPSKASTASPAKHAESSTTAMLNEEKQRSATSQGQSELDKPFLMRSEKRSKSHRSRVATLEKNASGMQPELPSASDSVTDIADLHVDHGRNANCDTFNYDKKGADEEPWWWQPGGQPKSMWWRLRMFQPCQVANNGSREWHVRDIQFYADYCEDIDEFDDIFPIKVIESWSSGEAHVSTNKQLAFDKDEQSYWAGVGEAGPLGLPGPIWIAARFENPEKVRCVRFSQCDCESSARWVKLEYNTDYQPEKWAAAPIKSNIAWGDQSEIFVKRVKKTGFKSTVTGWLPGMSSAQTTLAGATVPVMIASMHMLLLSLRL